MPRCKYDSPYLDRFTPNQAAFQRQRLSCLPLLQNPGLRLEKVEQDIAPSPDITRLRGAWQGGILAGLIDTAAGLALRTTLKLDHDAVTVRLDTKCFLPVDQQRVFAEGSVVRRRTFLTGGHKCKTRH